MKKITEDLLLCIEKTAIDLEKGRKQVDHPKLPGFKLSEFEKKQHAALMDQVSNLCDIYLEAEQQERKGIRDYLKSIKGGIALPSLFYVIPNALYGFVSKCANDLQSIKDVHLLRRGLAAAAIETGEMDYRDLLVSLGDLFLKAERIGIDPVPYFKEVARLSDERGERLIENFYESAHLKSIRGK